MTARRIGLLATIVLACALCALGLFWRKSQGAAVRTASAQVDSDGDEGAAGAAGGGGTATETTNGPIARRASIAGRVTDGANQPIAGAAVCAVASSDKLVSADVQTPFCATTGADGRYRLGELFSASYRVSATATGHQPGRFRDLQRESSSLLLKAGESREGIDILLDRGGVEVRGRVKDISGGNVAGALVTVEMGDSWNTTGMAVARSGAQGEWSLSLAPGKLTAHAAASGYNTGTKSGIAPGQVIEILLTPESVLQGRVVEAGTETPVVGARVSAGELTQQTMGFDNGPGHTVLTDTEGRFRIPGLDPGRYKPTSTAAHRFGIAGESVLLGLAETSREIVIEMHAALAVSGRIDLGGKGCEDGYVSLTEKGTKERRGATSDRDGRARIDGLFPGTYTVDIWCNQAAKQDRYEPVVLGAKDITGVVWKVSAGLTARGVVVDAAGQPVAGAEVSARTKGGDPRSQFGWAGAESHRDGSFVLRGLLAAPYSLEVHREGITPLKDPFELKMDHDVDGVRLVLPAGGLLEGTVVDSSGAPASGLDVRARGDRLRWNETVTTSKDDGSFVFNGLNPGDYHVQAERNWSAVRAPGTKDDDTQGTTATVRPGETARVKLVVESQRGEIHGRVVDHSGVPLSDAFVDAERQPENAGAAAGEARRNMQWQWGSARSPVLTDTDGNFTLTKLSPGSYTVRAFRKGGGETVAENVGVGTRVTLTIRKEGAISGTVTDSKGKAPERFSIQVRDEKTGVSRQESFFRTQGAWTVSALPEGSFHVAAEGHGRALTQVKLAQGERREGIRLSLEPNASVHGRIVSLESSQPVPGMMVFARPAKGADNGMFMIDDTGDRKNVSDADGRFEVDDAPAGRVLIIAFPKDWAGGEYSNVEVAVTLEAGGSKELAPIRVARSRVKGELTGDLGFHIQEDEPGADPDASKHVVSAVREDSAAAKAGLVVGDEITSVDGYDVVGPNGYLYAGLSRVADGVSLKIGLRRGASIVIKAERHR